MHSASKKHPTAAEIMESAQVRAILAAWGKVGQTKLDAMYKSAAAELGICSEYLRDLAKAKWEATHPPVYTRFIGR